MAIYRNQAGAVAAGINTRFYNDVIKGLSAHPKYLLSKYFYDTAGDRLFQQIMACPEYYLTRSEMEILHYQTEELCAVILKKFKEFDIVELGAGDATKSVHLLQQLKKSAKDFTYFPVDISKNIIHTLENELPQRIKGLKVKGLHGDYFDMIRQAYAVSQRRKIVLFLGSSIGNFNRTEALHFLESLHDHLLPGDLLLTGFDLRKNPKQILAAYNDKEGITKAFNLNLLTRINRELIADFDISQFDHYPTYDPISGACHSFLISLIHQEVVFNDTIAFSFEKDEPIRMELSQKFSIEETELLAQETGFIPAAYFFDSKQWFMDVFWERL